MVSRRAVGPFSHRYSPVFPRASPAFAYLPIAPPLAARHIGCKTSGAERSESKSASGPVGRIRGTVPAPRLPLADDRWSYREAGAES